MIELIVAYDENRVIGKDGKMPWHISGDLKHFKDTTLGHACIMGRNTWNSLPKNYRPLPGRLNLVLTRNTDRLKPAKYPNLFRCFSTLEAALNFLAHVHPYKKVFVVGGEQVYRYTLQKGLADAVIASEVHGKHEGDTYFPKLIGWKRKVLSEHSKFNVVEYKPTVWSKLINWFY